MTRTPTVTTWSFDPVLCRPNASLAAQRAPRRTHSPVRHHRGRGERAAQPTERCRRGRRADAVLCPATRTMPRHVDDVPFVRSARLSGPLLESVSVRTTFAIDGHAHRGCRSSARLAAERTRRHKSSPTWWDNWSTPRALGVRDVGALALDVIPYRGPTTSRASPRHRPSRRPWRHDPARAALLDDVLP